MRCEEIRLLLDLRADGQLSGPLLDRVERHLLGCQSCSHEASALAQTGRLVRLAVATAGASPAFRERTSAHLLNALRDHLRPEPPDDDGRQWTLPFPLEEQV